MKHYCAPRDPICFTICLCISPDLDGNRGTKNDHKDGNRGTKNETPLLLRTDIWNHRSSEYSWSDQEGSKGRQRAENSGATAAHRIRGTDQLKSIAKDEQETRAACADRLVEGESDSAKHSRENCQPHLRQSSTAAKDRREESGGKGNKARGLTCLRCRGRAERGLGRGCLCHVW